MSDDSTDSTDSSDTDDESTREFVGVDERIYGSDTDGLTLTDEDELELEDPADESEETDG